MVLRLFYSCMCFLVLSALGMSSYAQEIEGKEYDQYFELSLEDLMNLEITVASKSNESFVNSPSSVYLFTAREIENMGVTSVEQLLNYVPGFFTGLDIEQGKANRIGARGRSTALSESVLFLINGHRINDLYTGGISIINRLIPVENIKQVEVIRGPGSSLYGSNAFLGVVNIVTKTSANDVELSYGSFLGYSAAANLSKTVGKVSVSTFVKGFSNQGYEFEEFTDTHGLGKETMRDPEQGFDAMIGIEYKGLSLEARHHEREFKGFYGLGGTADFNNNEQSSQSMINLGYRLSTGDHLALNFKGGYKVENWKTKSVILPTGLDIGFVMTEDFFAGPFMKSEAFNGSVDASYQISAKNELLAGASFENAGILKAVSLASHDYITFDYFGGIREYSLPFNKTDERRNIIGLFVQDKHVFNDQFRITFGARFDSYSDFGSSLNPRGAFIYSTPINSTLKVMYGQAFRAPNYLELHDQNNPVDYGNTELKAETIKTFEVAYTHSFSIFSATLTYFQNTIENLIFLDPKAPVEVAENNPLEAPSFYNQEGEVNTSGIEASAILKPANSFSLNATFTHLRDAITGMPENMISARINYKFGKFNLNVNGIYHGEIEEVSNQSGYTVLNTKLGFQLEDITLFGQITNITDELYRTPTSLYNEGVINRGRIMTLGVKVNLN